MLAIFNLKSYCFDHCKTNHMFGHVFCLFLPGYLLDDNCASDGTLTKYQGIGMSIGSSLVIFIK